MIKTISYPLSYHRRAYLLFLILLLYCSCANDDSPQSFLIRDAFIVDGTGAPAYQASVRINGEKIKEIGTLSPKKNETTIQANGLYLSPGFIDTHSHHDRSQDPVIEAANSQGITTIIAGQDGGSHYPLSSFFDSLEVGPLSVNIASYAGHNTLRSEVMKQDYKRKATELEIHRMDSLLQRELASGALGLSTGLEYDPGIYSDPDEVLQLAKTLKPMGGRYISHLRSEDRYFESALEEIINIGKEAGVPVQVSHMKLARKSLWGEASRFIGIMEEARSAGIMITADVYPYEYWQSTMTVLFPERDFSNRESAEYALTELTTPDGMIVTRFNADSTYIGKSISEIAKIRNQDPVTTYMDLIALSRQIPGESVVAKSMSFDDIIELYQWDHSNVCSDGSVKSGHPRGWGTFPRFIAMMVKETKTLTLENAIRKMTSLAAEHMGIKDRGKIETGVFADLVLFDLENLKDQATIANPNLASKGIHQVWVNGQVVYKDGKSTGLVPGKVIRK